MQKINSSKVRILALIFSLTQIMLHSNNADAQATPRTLNIDVAQVKGELSRTPLRMVNAGRAAEGLRKDWQDQLRITKKECGFDQIRFHGILNEEMDFYKEDAQGNPQYNWAKIDTLYDFLVEIGMKPFVELSFMPAALRSNDQTTCYWKAFKSPPNSYPKYEALIEAFVRHLQDRYGHDEVKTWSFEVWNEPNLKNFFTGDQAEYFKLYATAARAVKRVSPDYRIGGPSTAGTGWVKEFMDYCEQNNVPVDFISTHFYGNYIVDVAKEAQFNIWANEGQKKLFLMKPDPDSVPNKVKGVREGIDASVKYKGLPLEFDEWSPSFNPIDPIHDAYQSTPYMLNSLKKTEDVAASMAYWCFSDIIEEIGPVPTGYLLGNWGLMDTHGLRKPAYFTYKYINQLGKTELANSDPASWACKSGDDIQLLLWNYKLLDSKGEPNNSFYKKLFPSEVQENSNINIVNVPNGDYNIEFYRVGYQSNDYYTAYAQMGKPKKPSDEQVQKLIEAQSDQPIKTSRIKVMEGKLDLQFDLRENDTYLIKIIKEN